MRVAVCEDDDVRVPVCDEDGVVVIVELAVCRGRISFVIVGAAGLAVRNITAWSMRNLPASKKR